MKFKWENDLPFISITLVIADSTIELSHALIDTGAASSLFNIDKVFENGMKLALKFCDYKVVKSMIPCRLTRPQPLST